MGFPGGSPKTEVLNSGVDGYGTAQEFLVLENFMWEYDPDIVLPAFFPGNNVIDNRLRLITLEIESGNAKDDGCKPCSRPFFEKGALGKLQLNNSFRCSQWLRNDSS